MSQETWLPLLPRVVQQSKLSIVSKPMGNSLSVISFALMLSRLKPGIRFFLGLPGSENDRRGLIRPRCHWPPQNFELLSSRSDRRSQVHMLMYGNNGMASTAVPLAIVTQSPPVARCRPTANAMNNTVTDE